MARPAFRIIPRAEWGARHGSSGVKRRVGGLEKWLHHSVTVAPDTVGPFTDDYAAIRTIEDIGRARFGRYGFPYTFAFTPAGLIFEGHPVDEVGAHTQGHNTAGAGFVLVGNYETDRPTPAQLDAVAWTLQEGKRRGWWKYAELDGGHRDTKATACPGRHAYALIDDINRRARGATIPTTETKDWLDMATESDLRKIIRAELRDAGYMDWQREVADKYPLVTDDKPDVQIRHATALERLLIIARRTERRVIIQDAALDALAASAGVDPADVREAVASAVDKALSDLSITLTTEDDS
jgi:hypothetical protein